jgi:hypothetical protein
MDVWSPQLAASVKQWSDTVAELAVDALICGKVVDRGNFEKAVAIVSEEVFARLCVHDYPPRDESEVRGPES